MNELALFAGAGGGILGGHLLGWRTVCAVEIEEYPRSVLLARQDDGLLPPFPIWDDICTFDGRPWRGVVDVVSGGFPCQDISAAGKGAGITGERSGLWREMARIVGEVRPRFVFVENSPLLVGRGLAVVLDDLAEMGYDARWGVVGADDAGAPHRRKRFWGRAISDADGGQQSQRRDDPGVGWEREQVQVSDADKFHGDHCGHGAGQVRRERPEKAELPKCHVSDSDSEQARWPAVAWGECDWWAVEPGMDRVAHGVAHRMDRLKALGNGQVPAVAALAWRILGGE